VIAQTCRGRSTPTLVGRAAAALLTVVVGTAIVVVPASPASADAIRDSQWYLSTMNVAAAHAVSRGEGVTVAVVDSGVDPNQPDLTGSVLAGADSYTSGGNGQLDPVGHGTAMAAFIAGHGHGAGNGSGILGIAPGAKILPLKLGIGRTGESYTAAALTRAIDTAVERGAKVISASIVAPSSDELRQAVKRALDRDVVIVASVGNLNEAIGSGEPTVPARYEGVVSVCATDRNGNHAPFSIKASGLSQLTVCAPGVDGPVAKPDGTYTTGGSGTSMSAALVAGAVALIRSKNPQMPAYEVVNRLARTAVDKGAPGRDELYGYGNLNLQAALTAQVAPTTSPTPWIKPSRTPTPTPATPSSAAASGDAQGDGGGMSGTAVAVLATAGGVAVAFVIGVGLWLVLRRRRTS
jgi:type VII secretion-associated serine protease mycosin